MKPEDYKELICGALVIVIQNQALSLIQNLVYILLKTTMVNKVTPRFPKLTITGKKLWKQNSVLQNFPFSNLIDLDWIALESLTF